MGTFESGRFAVPLQQQYAVVKAVRRAFGKRREQEQAVQQGTSQDLTCGVVTFATGTHLALMLGCAGLVVDDIRTQKGRGREQNRKSIQRSDAKTRRSQRWLPAQSGPVCRKHAK